MSLKIAIQKSGRLYDDSISLLKKCGLKIDNAKNQLKAPITGFNAEAYFLRNSDIPQYLADGVVDMAIIGENVLIEKAVDVNVILKLGFSQCRLSIATAKGTFYNGPTDLIGKKIATSYPTTLAAYLDSKSIEAEIHNISGSVEIAPNIGLADAVCDLVSSGSTLFQNNLIERETLLRSEAVFAVNKKSFSDNRATIEELAMRMLSVTKAKENKYILFNIPNNNIPTVSNILPVLKSPTVLPLVQEGWSSMHSVISQSDFWSVISELRSYGAEGILVLPIDNMII